MRNERRMRYWFRKEILASMWGCEWPTTESGLKMCYFWRLAYHPPRIEKNVLELAGNCDTYLNDPNLCTLCHCFVDFSRNKGDTWPSSRRVRTIGGVE